MPRTKKVVQEEKTPTVPRAIEFPARGLDKHTNDLLRECWHQASMLANWAVHTLTRCDVVRTPKMVEYPEYEHVELYAMAFGRKVDKPSRKDPGIMLRACEPLYEGHEFFSGATKSGAAILNQVQSSYVRNRYNVLWRRQRAPEHYADPAWWPINSQSWHDASIDQEHKPCIRVSLPGGRVDIPMRGGEEFARQLATFRGIVQDPKKRRQVVIRWQRCSNSAHRPTLTLHGVPGRIMVKMVADVEISKRPGDRTLVLLTDPNAFWVADLDGRPAWILNNDHWRRCVGQHQEHLRRLQRMSEDAKSEKRIGGFASDQQAKLDALCHKDHNRMASFTHEAAANLVNFARRQGVGEILYLDRDKGFIPRFPWRVLHDKLQSKCVVGGIDFYSETLLSSGAAEIPGGDSQVISVDLQPSAEDEKWCRIARLREMATKKVVAAKKRKRSHPAVSTPQET